MKKNLCWNTACGLNKDYVCDVEALKKLSANLEDYPCDCWFGSIEHDYYEIANPMLLRTEKEGQRGLLETHKP